jgi:hypothetical protein
LSKAVVIGTKSKVKRMLRMAMATNNSVRVKARRKVATGDWRLATDD